MTSQLEEKNWTKEIEKQIYTEWKDSKRYKFNKNSGKKVYSIDTPPPYINTPIHIGQATTYVLMDMFARFHRMKGREILYPLGLDANGLPIEMAVEKKFNIKITETSRVDFIEYCHKLLQEHSMASTESFLRLGIGFNSWEKGNDIGDVYETDSPDYRSMTQDTFIDLWNNELIYEDERTNNYCPGCQTTIADAEIDYAELPSFFNDIKFKIKETGEEIIIGTTRPELVCTCEMICYNPEDERYKHLEGKHAITPLFNKVVPIKPDPVAQMDKGTGLMMMCSFGDVTDIRFFRDNGLKPIIAINKDGTMNENAGFLAGLSIKEAQKRFIIEADKQGLLVKQQKIKHRTPICERSKDPIEFISMKEFYLKQLNFINKMYEIAKKPRFFAEESRKILFDWINSVSIDWPISRRRYYATEIPLWYCTKCNHAHAPEKGKYYQPWKEKCPIETCPECGNTGKHAFRPEERVFDTWFDSSISPLYILKYSRDDDFFKKNNPCSLRPQGKEIIRTWLYYTLLKDYLLTGECIFEDVWINYHILDDQGKKMSKSTGNIIDPKDILDKFGAEPFRLWSALEGNLEKTDFRCSLERIEGSGKTISKLWNLSKFTSLFKQTNQETYNDPATHANHLTELDKWILNEANVLIIESNKHYAEYDFHTPATLIRHFIWETFASHYVELVKNRAYNQNKEFTVEQQDAAIHTLHKVLAIILKLLAPIMPMITYRIYKEINGKDIHFEAFPNAEKEHLTNITKDDIIELNSFIWKSKKDNGLSLKDEIKELVIDHKFKTIQHDIISAHNIKKLEFGERKIML
ncbi:TPA: valine--tRNA ligase [Candidatus Woesearchaeota archaeon]|nr:valine--tRNA ligase [Candidatus Woesearchaeota archaeon]HIH31209.1 valine--tRNA ligase [Candidatus Woesearchaeota archaeon]HIH55525.1 valine--tRNA ligase [Candidatus Woesearchaeota archaeon]HIJ02216.1 valine--tRNA ligase [Candidatus Woesearchaeota archaeon]HIJ13148.1 valine--tRNA ligase [Candidatus Woesearchaeota archaeon]